MRIMDTLIDPYQCKKMYAVKEIVEVDTLIVDETAVEIKETVTATKD